MKRLVSLLLGLLLLLGMAQSEPAAHIAAIAETGALQTAQPEAEAEELGNVHGRFSLSRGAEMRLWEFSLTLERAAGDEAAFDLPGLTLGAWVRPVNGPGSYIEVSLQVSGAFALSMFSGASQTILQGDLLIADAQSGETRAHYALFLGNSDPLVVRDLLSGGEWTCAEAGLALQWAAAMFGALSEGQMSLSEALDAFLGADIRALFDALDALSDGGEITIALRELLLPLSQSLSLELGTFLSLSDLVPDSDACARSLAHLLRGEATLTRTDEGLRAVYYSEGSPELSAMKLELEAGKSGLKALFYENMGDRYATVGRVEVALDESLRLRAEDYARGGFLYLDVRSPAYADDPFWSLMARLSASPATGAEVRHAELQLSCMPERYAQATYPGGPLPYTLSFTFSGEGGPTTFMLYFDETFSD